MSMYVMWGFALNNRYYSWASTKPQLRSSLACKRLPGKQNTLRHIVRGAVGGCTFCKSSTDQNIRFFMLSWLTNVLGVTRGLTLPYKRCTCAKTARVSFLKKGVLLRILLLLLLLLKLLMLR